MFEEGNSGIDRGMNIGPGKYQVNGNGKFLRKRKPKLRPKCSGAKSEPGAEARFPPITTPVETKIHLLGRFRHQDRL